MDTLKTEIKIDSTINIDSTVLRETTIKTVTTVTSNRENDFISELCDCQLLQGLIWPITVLIIIVFLRKKILTFINLITDRIKKGYGFKISKDGIELQGTKTAPFDKETVGAVFDPTFPIENEEAKKILNTFWKFQNQHDPTYNIRWTFIIGGNAEFDSIITKLHWLGITAFDMSNNQYFLTDFGLEYCKKHQDNFGEYSYFE